MIQLYNPTNNNHTARKLTHNSLISVLTTTFET